MATLFDMQLLAPRGASGVRADRCAPQVPKLDGETSVNDKLTSLWGG